MIERWSRDQVLSLAPDASSRKAAQGVAAAGKWRVRGVTGEVLFGECQGSGASPYQACVDLSEPAFRCGCPSRKFPCKHALGLLLLWSADGVPETDELPAFASEWLAQRDARAARSAARLDAARGSSRDGTSSLEGASSRDGASSHDGGSPRHARVAAGLAEVERWLADQIRQGLATAAPHDWEGLAKRLVDAQAPGMAGTVARLARVREEDEWPGRLLEEYALLHLLAVAYRRRAELPPGLAETVLMRVGFPVTREEVLVRPAVRDRWDVLGLRDEEQDRLTARRVWLRGRETGRAALVLSFAPSGQPLDASLVTGTTIDADLAFYPGAAPLRALVARRHGSEPCAATGPPPGAGVAEALEEVAAALAADPWTESWPLVLTGVVPGEDTLAGFPLLASWRGVWRLLAVSGGHPVTVAAEWTPRGLRPLTTWDADGTVVIL
ncbi:SWIM zinc finger family protein [Nonomuraea sp. MCN248]|uniref:SWIM zinc finger family protein n=1 Tax=Nonomuraea corallina TaxID=2989783 RepID=A0ABT4S7X4_9ACTN|nr:SWIM zinc finger family protein [Nonomuraea corallina]MDA0633257.1 SWIM zinc finger family protein [Nonomuraea corallina]